MDDVAPKKLSQGVNYLGFLNAKLRDLRGWTTLANELIQNADDTPGATCIEFDVTDDALIVWNDGKFSDCGQADNIECAGVGIENRRKTCDFHAFRDVARGHKREQEGTTGAFGIGFISVYQITDHPILISGLWKWELHPENPEEERIHAWELDTPFDGTCFEFRWARASSELRQRLGVQTVPETVVNDFIEELRNALSAAAPFLKRLGCLRLKKNGKEVLSAICEPQKNSNEILVDICGSKQIWIRFEGDFSSRAAELRNQFGSVIEDKRKSNVTLVIPTEFVDDPGRYYAALPTEHEFDAPILINADFFPSNDRKKVLFTNDYQGQWNRAAIRAAANALAKNLLELRDTLTPRDLWKLFSKLRDLKRTSDNSSTDDAMGALWAAIQPVIQAEPLVYTNKQEWKAGSEVRLLQSKEEESIRPFLDYLGIDTVHPDLRESATLLREKEASYVSYLSVKDLVAGMERWGLTEILRGKQIPKWLRESPNQGILVEEFDRLIDRAARDKREELIREVKRCALVVTTAGALAPPKLVRWGNPDTREIFDHLDDGVLWLDPSNSRTVNDWISSFSLQDAIAALETTDADAIQDFHDNQAELFQKLLRWILNACQSDYGLDESLKRRVQNLKIWPAAGVLQTLHDVSVPGDYIDPLGLANVLDGDVIGNLTEVLVSKLGASQLTLQNYVHLHVPRAFNSNTPPVSELRIKLVELLAKKIGELRDELACQRSLRTCPIVRCQDGDFRVSEQCYFDSEIVSEVLGNTAPLAMLPMTHHESVRDLFEWLEVSSLPRPSDIVKRISEICVDLPNKARFEQITKIFRGISDHWHELEDEADELKDLQEIKWLPALECAEWLAPSEVYVPYSKHLFASQAKFLAIPFQRTSQTADFFKFLGVPDHPNVGQVVKHLIYSAKNNQKVNTDIYRYLNDQVEKPEIKLLKGESCLLLGDGKYIRPEEAYWSSHPFGRYRKLLSEEWNNYRRLLKKLRVNDEPSADDAIAVLLTISDEFSKKSWRLDDDEFNIVLSCWKLISDELENFESFESRLKGKKTIPDSKQLLTVPEWIFFEDKPRLAEKFSGKLGGNVVAKPEGAWTGMHRAGVRMLSEAVTMRLVECEDPQPSHYWQERMQARRRILSRVFSGNPDLDLKLDELDDVALMKADKLSVSYSIRAFEQDFSGIEEDEFAFFDTDVGKLYVVGESPKSAGALAREIAFAICADTRASQLASGIKEVLVAETEMDADQSLDDLGFPPAELRIREAEIGDEVGIGTDEEIVGDEQEWSPNPEKQEEEGRGEHVEGGGSSTEAGDEEDSGQSGDEEENLISKAQGKDKSGGLEGDGRSTGQPSSRPPQKGMKKPPARHSRLRSYVGHGESAESDEHPERQREKTEVEKKGVVLAMRYEKKKGRKATEMPPNNEGYDIESLDENGQLRYIEVKARSGEWDQLGVGLTDKEFKKAQLEKENYWLYVIENAGADNEYLYILQDPATKVTDYYYDDGWKDVCDHIGKVKARSLRDLKRNRDNDNSSAS